MPLFARMPFICAAIALMGATPAFDPKPWLEDLNQARDAFTHKYANFDWAAEEIQRKPWAGLIFSPAKFPYKDGVWRGVLELPDCARLRANGDKEAAGVQPDLLIGFRRYDGVDRQAKFLREKLPEAERLAKSLMR